MKQIVRVVGACFLIFSFAVAAAALESYQVTGPVLDVKDNAITVQKGKEKWEIARDKDTKVSGDVKVGDKVTIKYQMKAVSIEGKAAAKAEKKETKTK